jgi:hypothetical protein
VGESTPRDPVEAQLDALIQVEEREELGELVLAAPIAQAGVDDHAAVVALAEAPGWIVDDHLDEVVGEIPVADPADRVGTADQQFRRGLLADPLGAKRPARAVRGAPGGERRQSPGTAHRDRAAATITFDSLLPA